MNSTTNSVTDLLLSWSGGREAALDELAPLVYAELKKTAHTYFSKEPAGHGLQTTALVHEVYLRLTACEELDLRTRAQFFAFAGTLMRNILTDYARKHRARKRGSDVEKVSLGEVLDVPGHKGLSLDILLDIDRALRRLEEFDPRAARVFERRFFAGLSVAETAGLLEISPATVKRDWSVAKKWLSRELSGAR